MYRFDSFLNTLFVRENDFFGLFEIVSFFFAVHSAAKTVNYNFFFGFRMIFPVFVQFLIYLFVS